MFGWIPEKTIIWGQRRGFEVAGNCSNLISTILVDEIQNIPLLLPLFNGRSKPCGCDSIPKIDLDPLHPLNPWKKFHACFRLYINLRMGQSLQSPFTTICPEPRNIHHISLISSSRRGWFSSNFFRSCHIWQPQPSTLETPSDLRGGMAHVPKKGGKLTIRICSGSLTVEKNMVDTWYAYYWKN